jgi:hypothetical protein
MLNSTKQYGISPPISIAEPTDADNIATDQMRKILESYNIFESEVGYLINLFINLLIHIHIHIHIHHIVNSSDGPIGRIKEA